MSVIKLPKLQMEGYVIVDPTTGLFSTGGTFPCWKKKGKVWSTIGHVKSHISQVFRPTLTWSSYTFDLKSIHYYKGAKVYEIGQKKEVLDVWDYIVGQATTFNQRRGYTHYPEMKVINT